MSVTDLTGTTWIISANPSRPAERILVSLNFKSNSNNYDKIKINDATDNDAIVYYNGVTSTTVWNYLGWVAEAYRTIEIIDGAGVTNSELIAWLEANASQSGAADVTILYNNSTIAEMSASGTEVLETNGKYMASDITIEYTKPEVPSGTAGTPVATKGAVSNHSVSVTPSVTNTTGYITGGTITGTAVTVSASELVSGTKSITSSGTTDVANYSSASVAAGSATAPNIITGASASLAVGANSLMLSKSVSVTPVVTAGYVASGTATNTSVSLSASVTTKGAATYTPGTTNQTIASGQWLSGTQTILGDANLTAENIKKDVSIFSVTGTYEGSGGGGAPSLSPTLPQYFSNVNTLLDSSYNNVNMYAAPPVGDTIQMYTSGRWELSSLYEKDTGTPVPYTTISTSRYGSQYSFVMPNVDVIFDLYYND